MFTPWGLPAQFSGVTILDSARLYIFWIMGWIVLNGAPMSMIIGGLGVLCILYWRQIEERNLDAQLGIEYQRYKKQTWF
jgi:protein-S-isoprenylcysteine O-methyltransferase Ste14